MTGMETMLPGGELLYRSACTYDRAGNRTGREEQYRDAFFRFTPYGGDHLYL